MMTFATFALEPLSPLHLGSRRAGVVAQTHRHAPGHLFTHALAAAVGMRRGTSADFFAAALGEVMRRFHFGPAFFVRGEERIDDRDVELGLVDSSHHVTLEGGSRATVESAMFEVELIRPGAGTSLMGGVWIEAGDTIEGRPLRDWLSDIRLGGEQKSGFGRVRCDNWEDNATRYPGIGAAGPNGLSRAAGEMLPGAALDGVDSAPLVPWVGRRHDTHQGFGRRLSRGVLVRCNGRAQQDGLFLPASMEPGLGCWQQVKA